MSPVMQRQTCLCKIVTVLQWLTFLAAEATRLNRVLGGVPKHGSDRDTGRVRGAKTSGHCCAAHGFVATRLCLHNRACFPCCLLSAVVCVRRVPNPASDQRHAEAWRLGRARMPVSDGFKPRFRPAPSFRLGVSRVLQSSGSYGKTLMTVFWV